MVVHPHYFQAGKEDLQGRIVAGILFIQDSFSQANGCLKTGCAKKLIPFAGMYEL